MILPPADQREYHQRITFPEKGIQASPPAVDQSGEFIIDRDLQMVETIQKTCPWRKIQIKWA